MTVPAPKDESSLDGRFEAMLEGPSGVKSIVLESPPEVLTLIRQYLEAYNIRKTSVTITGFNRWLQRQEEVTVKFSVNALMRYCKVCEKKLWDAHTKRRNAKRGTQR